MSDPRNVIDLKNIENTEEKPEDLILTPRKFANIPEMFKSGGRNNTADIVEIIYKKENLEALDEKFDGVVEIVKQEKKKESMLKRWSGRFMGQSQKETPVSENNKEETRQQFNSKRF